MSASITAALPVLTPGCRVRHPDHALGVVVGLEGRNARIHFDNGVTMIFNPRSAPLCRVTWVIGQQVAVQSQGIGVVQAMNQIAGNLSYRVQLLGTGQAITAHESQLSDVPEANQPEERLARGQFDDSKLFYYRSIGHYLACARQRLGNSHVAARITPKPHQIFVAQRVVNAPRPRFLLADEVGLGKTIEAGLILQELRARGGLERVLIVVPANLTLQWLYELRSKFNERFKLYDTANVRAELEQNPGENVWNLGRNIICSHSYITSHPEVWNDILSVPWDMVIFDEAHHIRRQLDNGRRTATKLYRFASQISERTRGLLLLTATPMQLDPFELFSLAELLDCALFYNYEFFEAQQEQNKGINAAIKGLVESDQLDAMGQIRMIAQLRQLLKHKFDLVGRVFESQIARDQVIELLAQQHLLSEVMIRNRKRRIGGFKKRLPQIIGVDLSVAERALYDAAFAFVRAAYRSLDTRQQGFIGFMLVGYQKRLTSSIYAFRCSIERRLKKLSEQHLSTRLLDPEAFAEHDLDEVMRTYGEQLAYTNEETAVESEIAALHQLLAQAYDVEEDSKYLALQQCLEEIFRQNPDERVLIFTQFLDTLTYLETQLQARWPVAVFHGRIKPRDKDIAVAKFQSGDARILIATEAGGEGRNLQFCAILVNYDLPWNPMKVEQRIGRLDRIGQERDVRIFNFALSGTVEEHVLDVLNRRIHAFEETVGGLDPILGHMEMDVQKLLLETSADQMDIALVAYGDRVEAAVQQARSADEALRDFVVDSRSYDTQAREAFDESEHNRLARHANKLSKSALKSIGASIRTLSDDSYSVMLGKQLKVELPGLSRDRYQITFNYQQALAEPLVEYGSFGHPLFDALLDYCTGETFHGGLTTRRTLIDAEHAGFCGFQFNFLVTLQSLHNQKRVVLIAVDCDGHYHPELRDLLLDCFDWRNASAPFAAASDAAWPALVERAYEAADQEVERQIHQEVAALKARSQEAYAVEKRKIDQYCDYRETEGQRKLAHDEQIVARMRQSERDEDHQVIPIWERNVENDRAYLQTVIQERERLNAELLRRLDIGYTYELLNAAWVEIIAPGVIGQTEVSL